MPDLPRSSVFQELKRRNVFRVAIAFVVVAWLVLQLVDILVPMLGLPEWIGRGVFLLLVVLFPVSLVLAWALELTPEGIKLQKHVDRDQSITHKTGRKLDFIIIGVLIAALSISVYLNFATEHDSPPAPIPAANGVDRSIAVLPFANRSNIETDAFFVDGMHDELLTQLAKISALKVISRTSVMQYRGTTKTIREIGKELGVATLLEGGVQRAGDRIRINVQLIDADADEHLWAETYNRELTASNIFEIQEQIASEIAGALHTALSPADQKRLSTKPTDNLVAYEAYMIGRQKLPNRKISEMQEAVVQFKRAIELDENFVLAYVGLAETYIILNNAGAMSKEDMLQSIRPLVAKARELDSTLGEVYNIMGGLSEYEGDFQKAETYYRKAIELSPGYTVARHWLALLLTNFGGRYSEAEAIYRRAAELDPLAANVHSNLAFVLSTQGKLEEAMSEARKAIAINPDLIDGYENVGLLLLNGHGDIAESMRWLQQAAARDPASGFLVGSVFVALGDFDSATYWHSFFSEAFPDAADGLVLALQLASVSGDEANAARLAEQALTYSFDTMNLPQALFVLRNHDIRQNMYGQALARYGEFFPELTAAEPIVHGSNVMAAVDLIPVLRAQGRAEQADRLGQRALALLQSMSINGFYGNRTLKAEVLALLDDKPAALAALSAAIESGWVTYWLDLPDRNPNFESLHDDPRFQSLLDEVRSRIARELDRTRELASAGKLAMRPEQLSEINLDMEL